MTRLALGAALAACVLLGLGDLDDERTMSVLRWLEVAPGVLLALAALSARRWPALPSRAFLLPLATWLGVLVVSAMNAPIYRIEASQALSRPASGALLALAVYALSSRVNRYEALVRGVAVGGAAVAAIGLLATTSEPVAIWLAGLHETPVAVADVPRLASTLSHPNVAAIVLELTLPLVLAWALSAPSGWRAPLLALAFAHLVALMLTFSRAALLAELVGLTVFGLVAFRRRARSALVTVTAGIAVIPLGLGVAAVLTPQVERRMFAELESTSYQAEYAAPAAVTVAPEQVIEVPVRVTNVGDSAWTAADASRVALGYHLLRTDGTPIEFDAPATLLPADVAPRASLDIAAHLYAPAAAGVYLVEWDALREGVAWFSWRGSPPAPMHLLVEPGRAALVGVPEDGEVALPRPSRVQFWSAALAMLAEHPVLGVGPDNFRVRFTEYSGVDEAHIGTHAHNVFLEALANTGAVGLLTLGWLLLALLRTASHALPTEPGTLWLWRAALLASIVAWLVHGLFDDLERFLPAQIAWWAIVGLAARGLSLQAERRRA